MDIIKEKVEKKVNKRESNFEILRIVAMIMIILHHIVVHSGFKDANINNLINEFWLYFILMGGKIGVNIFVLISGYFLINSEKIKITKILKLWGQIAFTSVIIYIIFTSFGLQEFKLKTFIKTFFPILTEDWWFATTYFILYVISPFLNILLKSIDKDNYKKMLCVMLGCWCVIPTLLRREFQGNSIVWFVILYSVAGYVRLHGDNWKINYKQCIVLSTIITMITYIIVMTMFFVNFENSFYFYEMHTVFIFLISFLLFLAFKKMNIKYNKIVNKLAATTFGIYLVHDNDYVRAFVYGDLFKVKSFQENNILIGYTILVCIIIFIACALIELIRSSTIEKYYMRIIYKIESRINNKINKKN